MQAKSAAQPSVNPELARECAEVANGFVLAAFDDENLTRAYLEQASHYFLKALEFDADCLEAYLGLAYLSALTGALDRARGLLAQAQSLAVADARTASLNEARIQAMQLEIERLLMLEAGEVVKLPDRPERPRRDPVPAQDNPAESDLDFSPNHLRFRTGKLPDLDAKG